MKTEIEITARIYRVEIRDNRTGENSTDTIALDKARLQAGGLLGLSDEEIIRRTYNRAGFHVREIAAPVKRTVTVDLAQLFEPNEAMQGGS